LLFLAKGSTFVFLFVIFQILPIGYKQQANRHVYLTNPLAVNFDRYLQQVEEAKELYKW